MNRRILKAGICLSLSAALLCGCGLSGLFPPRGDQPVSSSATVEKDVRTVSGSVPEAEEREETPEKSETTESTPAPVPTEEPEQEKAAVTAAPVPEETSAPERKESPEERVRTYLEQMTLEEKVAQMFLVLPESLTGTGCVTAAGDATRAAFQELPVGGFTYMQQNLESERQVREMLEGVQAISMDRLGLPAFTCVDEEGGTVTRISGRGLFAVPEIGDMRDVGSTGDPAQAYQTGVTIGGYLKNLGFNVDFAPVADVFSNPENQVVRWRSFGSDPELVSEMAAEELRGLTEQGILGCYKHFPGHGATAGDTHSGYAYTEKSLEELAGCELIPFQRGIEEQAPMIMVGHISLPSVTGEDTPASLSYQVVTEILRGQMGYQGIVVTDAMNMGAVANTYSSAQAAVLAVQAGVDMILMPADLYSAYEGVLTAVEEGVISRERIDESLERILRVKLSLPEQDQSS